MTFAFGGILLFVLLAVLLGLGAYWASRSTAGRWVMGAVAVLAILFIIPVYTLRMSAVPHRGQMREIRVEDGFEGWKQADPVAGPGPRPAWVGDAGGSGMLSGNNMEARVQIRTPGPDGALVGYSPLLETQEAAVAKARESLQDQIQALIEWQLSKENRLGEAYAAGDEAVRRAIAQALDGISSPTELHAEPVRLPQSGQTAFRAAVLTRVPPHRIEEASARVLGEVRDLQGRMGVRRVHFAWTLVSAAGLAIFIVILYTFLNAGTKGHLAWPLRLASVAAFLVLCLGLLVLRGHLQ